MASFRTDAELMTNYVAASAVPAGSLFKSLLDNNGKPMVISLSNDKPPKLQVGECSYDHNLYGARVILNNSQFDTMQTVCSICSISELVLTYPRMPLSKPSTVSKIA
jgi:hypothetical protein